MKTAETVSHAHAPQRTPTSTPMPQTSVAPPSSESTLLPSQTVVSTTGAPPVTPVPAPPLAPLVQRVRTHPQTLNPANVRQLHRAVGNQAVGRLLTASRTPSAAPLSTPALQARSLPEPTPSASASPVSPVNATGLPDRLKAGVEALSGISLDDVSVHYNSASPAQVQAEAYTQGNDIHVAPGQEPHLPHEAWHVVQQMQGRVQPTMQTKSGVAVNDDAGLEREADVMGDRALQTLPPVSPRVEPGMAAKTPQGAPTPMGMGPRVTQLYQDLKALYDYDSIPLERAGDKTWLDDFIHIQNVLSDKTKVETHLQLLNDTMTRENLSLTAALSKFEKVSGFSPLQPLLIGFVPAPVFRGIVRGKQTFQDLVAKPHGVQTHRLQWYIINQEVAQGGFRHTGVNLYAETADPRWIGSNGKDMWQNMVDNFNTQAINDFDFTSPDKLEAFLLSDDVKAASPELNQNIQTGSDTSRTVKAAHQKFYKDNVKDSDQKKLKKANMKIKKEKDKLKTSTKSDSKKAAHNKKIEEAEDRLAHKKIKINKFIFTGFAEDEAGEMEPTVLYPAT